jgi:DNA-binding SARP family transcriptional activator
MAEALQRTLTMRLQLHVLGAFQARLNDFPLRFAYTKQAALLVYLAMSHGLPVARRSLGLLLWPDKPPDAVQTNLRKVVSSLRKLLHEVDPTTSPLLVEDDGIQLSRDLDLWLDVAVFQARLADCTNHRHRHAESCSACYAARRTACDLYGGDFLADLVIDDSDTFDAWVTYWREALRLQALAACQALAEYSLQRGRLHEAYAEAQRLLRIDPLHEEGNQLVLVALAGLGQYGQAWAHYEQFRRLLQREVDVGPSAAVEHLAASLRAGTAPAYGTAGRPGAQACLIGNLEPSSLEPLIGRTVEVNELNAWLNDPRRRLITMTGLGGVGKTHLAGADLDVLSSLVDHSLLYVSAEGRYSWHELVQQYCAEELAAAGQDQQVARRHFAYYLARAEANAAELSTLSNLPAFLWFGRERANLQAAADWAGSNQDCVAAGEPARLLQAIDRAGYRKGVHSWLSSLDLRDISTIR